MKRPIGRMKDVPAPNENPTLAKGVAAIRTTGELLSETLNEWFMDGASKLAASIAFYTVFSLAPILVILVAVAGVMYGEETIRERILTESLDLIGPQGAQIIATTLEDARENSGAATTFGIVGLLFGATAVFVGLQDALNTIWAVAPKPSWSVWPFLRRRLVSFLMALGLGLMVVLALAASAAVNALLAFTHSFLPFTIHYFQILNFVVWLAVVTLAFAGIYKILPDARIEWQDVWVGAITASVLFMIGKTLIGLFLTRSTVASAYGAASSLVVFLLWIYYSAQIFLLCGEFTQVYARWRGAGITPNENAVRVVKSYLKA
ncbi:MAG TPA: YihY/virulence factor BrkB family protein [Terriglobia bacterium]|nr:YihY/virulence factor BrkB family protein [Terriglobia bacterium]